MNEYEGDEGEGSFNEDYFGQEISQGTGQLDADGVLHVTVPTEIDVRKRDYSYRIEAHVTDASNREIVGGHGVTVTYSTIVVLAGDRPLRLRTRTAGRHHRSYAGLRFQPCLHQRPVEL